jgi:hypothetical protein
MRVLARCVAIAAHVAPLPYEPAMSAFLRVIVCGRIARSTVLLSRAPPGR